MDDSKTNSTLIIDSEGNLRFGSIDIPIIGLYTWRTHITWLYDYTSNSLNKEI